MSNRLPFILKASVLTASSSVVNVLGGIARMKVLAIFVGPAGVGLYGVLSQLLSTTTTVALVGLNTSGVRALAAAAQRGPIEVTRLSIAVWRVSISAAVFVAAITAIFAPQIADALLSDRNLWPLVAWLGIGIVASGLAAPMTISLQARRDISRLSLLTSLAAIFSTVVTIGLAIWFGARSVAAMVIAIPIGTLIVACALVRLKSPTSQQRPTQSDVWNLVRFGAGVMAASFATTGAILAARAIIVFKLGLEATGLFHAMWVISMSYIGFALTAMSAEYFPRLSSVAGDSTEVNVQVNEQMRIVLLLATPMLVGMIGFSQPLLRMLFSDSFATVSNALRWQIVGDFFKLCSWPIGFIFLAHQRTRAFITGEIIWAGTFLAALWLLIPRFDLLGAGIAYLIGYIVYFAGVIALAHSITGFKLERSTLLVALFTLTAVIGTISLAETDLQWRFAMTACLAVSAAGCWAVLLWSPESRKPLASILRKISGRG